MPHKPPERDNISGMTIRDLQSCIQADLYRYDGAKGGKAAVSAFFAEPGFRLTTLLRICRYLRSSRWGRWGFYHFVRFWLRSLTIRLGVYIDPDTEIGPGLFIAHPCGIVINRRCRIGADLTLSQNVTLGRKSRPPNEGCPGFGDRVYIGPGAVVIGAVTVGDDSAIGANCVVTKEVPQGAVVVGVPARMVSDRGSAGYVTWCSTEAGQNPA